MKEMLTEKARQSKASAKIAGAQEGGGAHVIGNMVAEKARNLEKQSDKTELRNTGSRVSADSKWILHQALLWGSFFKVKFQVHLLEVFPGQSHLQSSGQVTLLPETIGGSSWPGE